MTRDEALALDAADDLADFRDEFVIDDPSLVYLDGNSLGRLPKRTAGAVRRTVEEEWGRGLVRSWHDWIDFAAAAGDRLAPLLGAAPGTVVLSDQTSVNLYKLAVAALGASGRTAIVTSAGNFPSDRYVLEAVAASAGGTVRTIETKADGPPSATDVAALLDGDVGLVSLSHVEYRSGAIVDMHAVNDAAHGAGAMTLWDLSHSAGAIPVGLEATGSDLAVGCTYKHLNGGPGAPAFLYVRPDLQQELTQPIPGWFGHADMFGFAPEYRPAGDIRRFMVGTPPIISVVAARCGIDLSAAAGIERIHEKVRSLTGLIIDRHDHELADLGFRLITPREATRRGAHVGLAHPAGYQITQALIDRGVIPDFRTPDVVRLGVSGLYTTHAEVWDGLEIMSEIVRSGAHRAYPEQRRGVT